MKKEDGAKKVTKGMLEISLPGMGRDEVFPDGYFGKAPHDIFGPRSMRVPLEKYSPSYMTDMFGAGIPEDIHRFDPRSVNLSEDKNSGYAGPDKNTEHKTQKERVILDPSDDRRIVTNTTMPPWRSICKLETVMTNGSVASGTGWFAARRVVVTAAHCIYDINGSEPSEIIVTPGLNRSNAPFSSQSSRTVRVPQQWVEKRTDDRFDFGIIILPNNQLGDQTGWFGYAVPKDQHLSNLFVNSAGYPKDRGNDTQVSCPGRIKTFGKSYLFHDIDTVVGQSGSPVFHKHTNGARTVIGIHTDFSGSEQLNRAVRITSFIFDQISDAAKSNP